MDYLSAKEKAINYIGISKKTEWEVNKKLKSLGVDSSIILRVIASLKELDYVNDEKYAKLYISQSVSMQKYSKYEIKQKLLQKGINIDIIEKMICGFVPDEYEGKVVQRLLNGKLKNYEDIKKKEYLYRRGFEKTDIER